MSDGVRKVSDGVGKVSCGIRKMSDCTRKVKYISKDSWQEAYVKHMEIKDLHVAIVFSPICGPIKDISFSFS